jgi:hypothetical protein
MQAQTRRHRPVDNPGEVEAMQLRKVRWLREEGANFDVFALHEWIEASETIYDVTVLTWAPGDRGRLGIEVRSPMGDARHSSAR